ncbi:hypothetical protein ACPPVT_11450 [Angustibacter sp. McL0619]|uniref:hypothetical protein n=1 Tax=Angustibacter sp. McL0619 TaxID=3415676 RepID=UPI003CF97526
MWWWILIWTLLLLGAAAVLALVTWKAVVRPGIALGRQLADTSELVAQALEPVTEAYRPTPSVLVDPSGGPDAPNPRSASRGRRRR